MGNCYSSGSGPELETSLASATVVRSNNKAQAGVSFEEQADVNMVLEHPSQTKAEMEKQLLIEYGTKLNLFVQGLQTSHPEYFNQVIFDLFSAHGGAYNYAENMESLLSGADLSLYEYRAAMKLEDGSLYEGTWNITNNTFEGLGVKVTSNALYEGGFIGGKAGGYGREIIAEDKEVYSGQFLQGFRQGRGRLVTEENTVYDGEWSSGKKHGHGEERWVDGARYEGDFKEGFKEGNGYFEWADKSNYNGTFRDNQISGVGVYRWADGRVYQGGWKENKMHGYGKFHWEDGRTYDGDYLDDKKHGFGRFTWPDGRIYEGGWADGRQHGMATYTSADGRSRKGEWVDGKRIKWIGEVDEITRSGTVAYKDLGNERV